MLGGEFQAFPGGSPFSHYYTTVYVDYSGNFAAVYPFTDMVFGTYNHPKLDNGGKVWSNYLAKNVGSRRASALWLYKAA